MNYWHWGVNFNNHPNSHYMFMLNNGILIGSQDVDYQIDDLVAVHKGHGLLAIALVTGPQEHMPQIYNGVDVGQRYGIIQDHLPYFVTARFHAVSPFMNGAGQIHNETRQRIIQALWNILDN